MDRRELQTRLSGAANPFQRRVIEARHSPRGIPIRGLAGAKWNPGIGNGFYSGTPLETAINGALDETIDAAGDPAAITAASDRMQAAAADATGRAMVQLSGIRVQASTNFLVPSLRWVLAFGEVIILADDQRPYWQNNSRQEINVSMLTGQDGQEQRVRAVKSQEEIAITLAMLKTDRYEYALRDINNGNVVQSAMANFDMAFDANAALERKVRTLNTASIGSGGSFGAFTFTGAKASRVFVAHSFIDQSNLPATNDFVIDSTTLGLVGNPGGTANTTTTGFRKEVFDIVTWYSAAWGDSFREGPVSPSGVILVPSSDVAAIGTSLGLAAALQSQIAEDIKAHGFSKVTWLGREYTLVPDNTLAPGTCFVPMNRPLFQLFLKPGMDLEDVQTDKMNNKESRAQAKVWGFHAPAHWRVNGLRIRYRTAA